MGRHVKVHTVKGFRLAVVREAQMGARDAWTSKINLLVCGKLVLGIEKCEDPLADGIGVHARVEERAKAAHRQKEEARDEHDRKGSRW